MSSQCQWVYGEKVEGAILGGLGLPIISIPVKHVSSKPTHLGTEPFAELLLLLFHVLKLTVSLNVWGSKY